MLPSNGGPPLRGWVVETIINGEMAWMIEPMPGTPYTFTFEFEKAHLFERDGLARDCMSAVWCWHDRHQQHPPLSVQLVTDDYRAMIAKDKS